MTLEQATEILALVTFLLVGVTAWYAITTARMLREMRQQARILSKGAQIAAWAGYINAAVNNTPLLEQAQKHMDPNPFEKVQQLAKELAQLEAKLQ
jgi:Na+-transporting NADH:ubiquinone oxidoreductase subunit NqrC